GVCTFDFGTREITLTGNFIGGSNAFEIRAAKLTIPSTGRLSASGGSSLPAGMITLTLGAGGLNVAVAPAARSNPVDVSGAGGGVLTVQSDGDVTINRLVLASARNNSTAAGKILITAGRQVNQTVIASGSITVTGKSGEGLIADTPTLSSMAGGTISLDAQESIAVGAGANGKIAGDGGSGGCGGAISFTTDGTPGPITIHVPVTATGTGADGGGGTVCVDGQGDATFSQGIDVSGGGGGGGSLDVSAIGTFTTAGAVRADGTGDGGCISFCAGGVVIGGPVTSRGLTAAAGGGVMVMADADVSVSAAGIVDVSSTDGNSGGCVDLEAGGNLRLAAGSIVDADAGATAGS